MVRVCVVWLLRRVVLRNLINNFIGSLSYKNRNLLLEYFGKTVIVVPLLVIAVLLVYWVLSFMGLSLRIEFVQINK